MPLFYFHVYNDEITMDEEGQDLPDIEAARREAVKSARALICDDVSKGRLALSDRIDVVDERGDPVLSLPFREAFELRP